ncbi:serine/threonine-protein kinase [Streptomyces sp. NRRL F-5727]|uniref:serine/threonine-protein kinase n=1 Tax=Streptomyces sp. NRRL F-5727 TaxID=1463871 RepID=UPI0004C9202C|nr:serine/threonine-protein kinase [Streptomyces sp. NRRL F-5727]
MEPLNAEDPVSIGPFRIVGRLGVGGMGRVFLARSAGGRTVAVKVVHAELAAQEEFRRRFAREVEALERVGGTGTAPVLGSDTTAAAPWVAIGYVPGPSLRTVVGDEYGPLPPATVRALGSGLGRALDHIHGAGLVHRDLKPSNVLLTVDGPRIIDFGIARAVDTVTDGGLTSTGAVVGSPGFMSPEQVRGERLGPASDIFCLGSVLAYAATGRSPFGTSDSGVHALMFRIAHDEPDLTDVAPALTGLIRACLAKDPEARPTAAEIAETLPFADPWLPAGVLARLGRHAARLLEAESAAGVAREAAGDATGEAADRTRGGAAPGDPTAGRSAGPAPEPEPEADRQGSRTRRRVLTAALTAAAVAAAAGVGYALWPFGGPDTTTPDGRGGGSASSASSSARPAGAVPAAFLGAWEGVLQGSPEIPRETIRIELVQGAPGAKTAVYTHVGDNRLCMGRSRLVSADEDKVVLGESDVTTSVPPQRCMAAAHQTLTLRSPEVLEWSSGTAKATFHKARTGSAILPAKYLGRWRMKPLVDGPDADRYTDEVTITQGAVGATVFRSLNAYPRTDEEGNTLADAVNCTRTAILATTTPPYVLGPMALEPGADSECVSDHLGSYLVLTTYKGEEILQVYPMVDTEPGEYHRVD